MFRTILFFFRISPTIRARHPFRHSFPCFPTVRRLSSHHVLHHPAISFCSIIAHTPNTFLRSSTVRHEARKGPQRHNGVRTAEPRNSYLLDPCKLLSTPFNLFLYPFITIPGLLQLQKHKLNTKHGPLYADFLPPAPLLARSFDQ